MVDNQDKASRRLEAARKGGRNVPREKRAFSTDRALASRAGKTGGTQVPAAERSFSKDRSLAAAAGRLGGLASQRAREKRAQEQHVNPSVADSGDTVH